MRERGRGEGSMETGMKGGNCGEGNGGGGDGNVRKGMRRMCCGDGDEWRGT